MNLFVIKGVMQNTPLQTIWFGTVPFLITDVIITQTAGNSGVCGGLVLFETDTKTIGRFRIAASVDGNEGWG